MSSRLFDGSAVSQSTPSRSGHVPRVAVVGAGPGGICMGVALRRAGIGDFTIFEQSDGIGGTWWDNVYPGAEVDVEVPLYSFSFHPFDFTRNHVQQPELLAYLNNVVDRFQLRPHIRLETAVRSAVWDESSHTYEVTLSDGSRERFHVVVSAVGILNHPRYPDWPGLERFAGPAFHSARWPRELDLSGKRVAVVGTGSTAAQLVPAIAAETKHLFVFQRQPGWVVPKEQRPFTPEERARISRTWYRRWIRLKQITLHEKLWRVKVAGSKQNAELTRMCEEYIAKVFADRPDLREMVTPDYPFFGKRPVRDSNFYPALLRDNVTLVPHAVAEVTEDAVIDETGARHEIDILVMCTGFQPANFLATMEIIGRGGRTIHEFWNGEARAYLGMMVPDFPNFYMMYGPNTNGAPVLFMHEQQAWFIGRHLRRMMTDGVTAIEVRPRVMEVFDRIVQKRLSRSVPSRYPSVNNYGRAGTGRDVIAWQDGMTIYAILARMTPRLSSKAYKRSGSST